MKPSQSEPLGGLSALFTAVMISSTVIPPLPSTSPAGHVVSAAASSAMLTMVTSSSTVTAPLLSQSPTNEPATAAAAGTLVPPPDPNGADAAWLAVGITTISAATNARNTRAWDCRLPLVHGVLVTDDLAADALSQSAVNAKLGRASKACLGRV